MLSNGDILIVLRRQIDSERHQKAAPIEQTSRDGLMTTSATMSVTTGKKSLLPFSCI